MNGNLLRLSQSQWCQRSIFAVITQLFRIKTTFYQEMWLCTVSWPIIIQVEMREWLSFHSLTSSFFHLPWIVQKNEEKFHFNTFGANKLNHNCESMNAETELSETFERCGFIKAFRLMFNDQIGEKFIDFFTIIFFGWKYILFYFLLG